MEVAMKKMILFAVLFVAMQVSAQMPSWSFSPPPMLAPVDTTRPVPPWTHKLVGSVMGNQVSFTDWQQGGEDAIAWTTLLDGKTVFDVGKDNCSTAYRFGFGQTKLGSRSTRKTDDRIEFESVYTRKLNLYVNPYVAATFKTQFAPGYTYDASEVRLKVSKFMDPGYFTQSLGLGYQPVSQVKARLGAGMREIFASEFAAKYTDDKQTLDKIEKIVAEGGAESAVSVDWKLSQNLLLTSLVEAFAAFNNFSHPMLRSNSGLAATVSKYVSVMFNVQTINEPRVSQRPQIKQALSVGLNYTFF
jgi:hypothetical protein